MITNINKPELKVIEKKEVNYRKKGIAGIIEWYCKTTTTHIGYDIEISTDLDINNISILNRNDGSVKIINIKIYE